MCNILRQYQLMDILYRAKHKTTDGLIHLSGRLYVLHCNEKYIAEMLLCCNVEQTTYCNDRGLSFVHDDKRLFLRE